MRVGTNKAARCERAAFFRFSVREEAADYAVSGRRFRERGTAETYALLLPAFLDTMGYTQRSQRKPPLEQLRGILERYLHCCRKFQRVHSFDLGQVDARQGDALRLELAEASVDAVLFSPPYSFAIDYAENDALHLTALGVDRANLDDSMIGLHSLSVVVLRASLNDHPSLPGSAASPAGRLRRSHPGACPKRRAKALLKWLTWE